MINNELATKCGFKVLNEGENKEVTSVYCCDLLSVVMGKAKSGSAWVTVMGNINSAAVAVLADISVIVLAEGSSVSEELLEKVKEEEITLLKSDKPVFETAKKIFEELNG